ncbi:NAD-binding protein [Pseudohaliea sp.]|uniref:potassium channel family protein n=1 Tax=Pseudohaliea sp. TaxID=2740289 RepID=UPI0032ED8D6E
MRERIAALSNFFFALVGLVLLYAGLFQVIMAYEGRDYSWLSGVYWTLVTMSTLGFGDIVFTSDVGRGFSVVVLLSGTVFMLVLLPVLFIELVYAPWVAAQSANRVPRSVKADLSGHVILTFAGPVARALIERLTRFGYAYVVVLSAEDEVLALRDEGIQVLCGELDDPDTYRRARIEAAAMVATTRSDVENTTVVFTARGVAPSIPIVSTVREGAAVDVLRLAGCNRTLNLAELMGNSLARRAIGGERVAHIVGHIDDIVIAEVEASRTTLVGGTLGHAQAVTAISIVGTWDRGTFVTGDDQQVIAESATLVMAGAPEDLKEFDRQFGKRGTKAEAYHPVLIVGGGRVGRYTARALEHRGIDYRIVEQLPERVEDDERYVTGSAAKKQVLESAGIRKAPTIIITTRDDDTNIYLTIYARLLRPDIQIIARSTLQRNVAALHRAGANMVISYASMGANAIFNRLKRSDLMMIAEGLDVFKLPVPEALAGRSLQEADIRAVTGCAVIGIDQHDNTLTSLRPQTVIPAKAEIILLGTAEGEQAFLDRFR